MADEKLLTERTADSYIAARVADTSSLTRQRLTEILPKAGGTTSTALAQIVRQTGSGSWPNPVRDANISGRIFIGDADATRPPTYGDGLRAGAEQGELAHVQVARHATMVPRAAAREGPSPLG